MEQRAATLVGGVRLKAPRRYYSVAIFSPRANLLTKAALISAVILVLFLGGLIWIVPVQDYNTEQHFAPRQPVLFSHEHHVGGLGLDCRYCHTSVEVSANAGMPPTETCMTCHSQIWTHAEMLAPVRQSLAQGKPLRWTRVYELPGLRFLQSQHPCRERRRLQRMPRADRRDAADAGSAHVSHEFCASIATAIRRRICARAIRSSTWAGGAPPTPPPAEALMTAYKIQPATVLTDCGICHR